MSISEFLFNLADFARRWPDQIWQALWKFARVWRIHCYDWKTFNQ